MPVGVRPPSPCQRRRGSATSGRRSRGRDAHLAALGRALERRLQLGHRLGARLGLLGQRRQDQRLDLGGQLGDQGARRGRRLVEVHVDQLAEARRDEGRPAADHLEQDDAQRVDVAAGVELAVAPALLGRHVGGRAHHRAGAGLAPSRRRWPAACSLAMPKSSTLTRSRPRRRSRRARGRGCRA